VKYVLVTVHVGVQVDSLANAQVAELRLFEICIYPNIAERADCHQTLPDLNNIARIDVSARHNPVNLSDNVTVTKVQLGLSEVPVDGLELCLGLFNGRCLGC
jgi:hypothetical protein